MVQKQPRTENIPLSLSLSLGYTMGPITRCCCCGGGGGGNGGGVVVACVRVCLCVCVRARARARACVYISCDL